MKMAGGMNFSARTAWELGENSFAAMLRESRAVRRDLLDLTISNPTACGFGYEEAAVLRALAEPAGMLYEPAALGIVSARQAVVDYYADCGASVPLANICLTTSTSEAYSFLFRLLCDADDEVLVASPSYPLFDFIARLDDVRLVQYPLLYHDGWTIDLHALEAAVTERTRAVIVVHPNNPTGHASSAAEQAALRRLCAERGLALIVDEVFLDFPLGSAEAETFAIGSSEALTFVLSGISKVCGLPQMKCSWIAAGGRAAAVTEAMERLEMIADTFLSLAAPTQHALPAWLAGRSLFQKQVGQRMRENVDVLDAALNGTTCQRLAMDGGWTCVLRVPRTVAGIPFAEAALGAGVVVQPGEFYGLADGRVVLSLLTAVDVWHRGVERLVRMVAGGA